MESLTWECLGASLLGLGEGPRMGLLLLLALGHPKIRHLLGFIPTGQVSRSGMLELLRDGSAWS